MAVDLFFDAASTTVSSGGTTAPAAGTVETWTVGSSTLFTDVNGNTASNTATPARQFRVVDPADSHSPPEVVLVTNVSGTTWTATRGADGTTPTVHTAGFTVKAVATSGSLTGLLQQGLGQVSPYSGADFTRCDPGIPVIQTGTYVATTAQVDVTVALCGEYTGTAGVQLVLAWGDNTLGRQPHPTTLAEFKTPPTGITYYKCGTVWPQCVLNYKATFAGATGAEQTTAKVIRITGLTVGHTYNWELCVAVVGGGTDAAPVDTATSGRPAVIRHQGNLGVWKAYLASNTGKRVDVAPFCGMMPFQTGAYKARQITFSNNVVDIVANRNQTTLCVLQNTSNAINVVDPVIDQAGTAYTPAVAPIRGDLLADGSVLLFIGGTTLNTMSTSAGTFGTGVSTTGTPTDVKVNPAGSAVWVLDSTNHAVRGWNFASGVIGTAIGSVTLTGTLTPNPSRMCVSSDGSRAWVTDDANGTLIEVNLTGLSQTRAITLSQAGPYVGCERFDGSDSTVLVVSQAGNASNTQIQQVNLADWTVWTTWQNVLSAPGATAANATSGGFTLTGDGSIFVSDVANNAINLWNGSQFALYQTSFLTKDYMDVRLAAV